MSPMSTEVQRNTAVKAAAEGPLSTQELRKLHACWRAANYHHVLRGRPQTGIVRPDTGGPEDYLFVVA
jgi:hypothetical protein